MNIDHLGLLSFFFPSLPSCNPTMGWWRASQGRWGEGEISLLLTQSLIGWGNEEFPFIKLENERPGG